MLTLFVSFASQAQTKEDVIAWCDTIITTPLNAESVKDLALYNAAILKWITESDEYTETIGGWIEPLMVKNQPAVKDAGMLFLVYVAAEIRYMLTHDVTKTNLQSASAAMDAVIGYYEANKEYMRRIPSMEKYIKLDPRERHKLIAKALAETKTIK